MGNTASMMGFAVPDLASNVGDYEMARLQSGMAATAAEQGEAWQAQMANTSWQRGVADMRAAGLNPALAYSQGGAATPSGFMAPVPSFQSGNSHVTLGDPTVMAQLRQLQAQTKATMQAGDASSAQAANLRAQAISTLAGVPNISSTRGLVDAQNNLTQLQSQETQRELNANPQWLYDIKAFLNLSPVSAGSSALGAAAGGAIGGAIGRAGAGAALPPVVP